MLVALGVAVLGSELLGLCWQCESRLLRLCVCGVRIEAWAWLCGRRGE